MKGSRLLLGVLALALGAADAGGASGGGNAKKGAKAPGAAEIVAAKAKISDEMKDPSSTQFKDVTFVAETGAVCGRVNAKNSYGAYAGYRVFSVGKSGAVNVEVGAGECDGYADLERLACLKRTVDTLKALQADCPQM